MSARSFVSPVMSFVPPRPTMSMFNCATMESRGTVGLSVKYRAPNSPSSSATCHTKITERFGFCFAAAMASAISSTVMDPDPSSSAPLKIESVRAGCAARSAAISLLICTHCSADGFGLGLSAPCGAAVCISTLMES